MLTPSIHPDGCKTTSHGSAAGRTGKDGGSTPDLDRLWAQLRESSFLLNHWPGTRYDRRACKQDSNVRLFNMLPHPRLKTPTAIDLHRELNRLKKGKLSWMYEVSKCAPQEALRDLDAAFSNFFAHRAGPPNFKSKKRGAGSFTLNS